LSENYGNPTTKTLSHWVRWLQEWQRHLVLSKDKILGDNRSPW